MARRRRSVLPVAGAVPPPELAERCVVEDWITPEELARLRVPVSVPTWQRSDPDWRALAMLLAWRRWRKARRSWLAEHGGPHEREAELIPLRRPAFCVISNVEEG